MNRTLMGWLLIIFSVTFAIGVLAPKVTSVHEISLEKSAKSRIRSNKEVRLKALKDFSQVVANNQQQVDGLISALPQDPQLPELLVAVEAMASQSSVTLRSILPQVNVKDQKVNLTLVGEGELGSVESLMQAVTDNNRPMSLTTFSLVKGQGASKILSFNLGLSIPYVEAASAKAAVSQ